LSIETLVPSDETIIFLLSPYFDLSAAAKAETDPMASESGEICLTKTMVLAESISLCMASNLVP
jgi:hypothetical protein